MRRTFVSHQNLGEHFKTEDLTVIYTECNEWVDIVQERLQESRFGKDSFWN